MLNKTEREDRRQDETERDKELPYSYAHLGRIQDFVLGGRNLAVGGVGGGEDLTGIQYYYSFSGRNFDAFYLKI